jgi:hypothetical protein
MVDEVGDRVPHQGTHRQRRLGPEGLKKSKANLVSFLRAVAAIVGDDASHDVVQDGFARRVDIATRRSLAQVQTIGSVAAGPRNRRRALRP